MEVIPTVTLGDGSQIPQVGIGVLRVPDSQTSSVVQSALDVGYRHIDTAAGYDNEAGVGQGLMAAGYADGKQRQQLWLTTKLKDSEQGYDPTLRAFDRQIALLRTDYIDMYMIHWPTPFDWRSDQTWKAFQRLRAEGRVRCLGVCNFLPEHMERLCQQTGEYPLVNQIELHPSWQQRETVAFCRQHGIAIESYSPLARGADLQAGNGLIERIAQTHAVTPAQVILRWHIQHGMIVIPKSVHRFRQKENIDVFSFSLSDNEMAQVDALDSPNRAGHDPLTFTYA
ncbi:aldo/keto reductase [Bombiscardovia coagulans]|uniref:2,5-diketo-D-gluconic acid reductase n=1 Tax=Bombiscardovia coagulans TaxID=686666 RepID=A0A261EUY5_9BIFI|nr:aldo/keto reductase [Bombiscardovia coagulans]OZG50645.1 2,5-diketo-D-gluconic acid reductase [Bombiscardovia coagulans]